MKREANPIASQRHATPGVEGYVFDGADGRQMTFWTCSETTPSAAPIHDFRKYDGSAGLL